jgi:integrase
MNGEDAPFYLGINRSSTSGKWLKKCAMGHNTIEKMMKRLAKVAGLEGRYTNHSLRRTMLMQLLQKTFKY